MNEFLWLPKGEPWIWGQWKAEQLKLQGRLYWDQQKGNLPAVSHHWVSPNWLKAKAAAPLVFYRVHKSMWNSICFAEAPAQTCLGVFIHIYSVHVSVQRDGGPSSGSHLHEVKQNWCGIGKGCRRIHRAMPLNLSAWIFHSVIGNHYSHSPEISLYFERFVKQMELHQ